MNFNEIQLIIIIVYSLAVVFPKLAIISLLLRVFIQKSFRIACYIIAGVLVSTAIGVIVASCLICHPFALLTGSISNCHGIQDYFIWAAFPNTVTDLAMLLLPIPFIAKMNLRLGVKIELIITFAAGGM